MLLLLPAAVMVPVSLTLTPCVPRLRLAVASKHSKCDSIRTSSSAAASSFCAQTEQKRTSATASAWSPCFPMTPRRRCPLKYEKHAHQRLAGMHLARHEPRSAEVRALLVAEAKHQGRIGRGSRSQGAGLVGGAAEARGVGHVEDGDEGESLDCDSDPQPRNAAREVTFVFSRVLAVIRHPSMREGHGVKTFQPPLELVLRN